MEINNSNISRSRNTKFLGITYDESMNFKFDVINLTLIISRHIVLLHQNKKLNAPYVLKYIYYIHIHSLLTYCNPIWWTTYPTYLIPLQLQLKKMVRIITNSTCLEHTPPLFKQTQILWIDDITKIAISTFMFIDKLSMQNDTRHCDQLRPHPHRLSKYCQSTLNLGTVYWNNIPSHIENSPLVTKVYYMDFSVHPKISSVINCCKLIMERYCFSGRIYTLL